MDRRNSDRAHLEKKRKNDRNEKKVKKCLVQNVTYR